MVEAGFVEVVYGGGDVGKHLVEHKRVRSIHLTGSAATFDAIVWGPDNIKKVGRQFSECVSTQCSECIRCCGLMYAASHVFG